MATISQIYGIDVSELGVVELNKKAFASIDFELFPPQREHFLIHAIQFQHKLPSQASMLRSQRRNQRKSGVDDANKKVKRPSRVIMNPKRGRRCFVVPQRVMPKPDRRRGRWLASGYATRLPTKTKAKVAHKPKKWAFKICSPERIALKCDRAACKQNIQKWRKDQPPTFGKMVDVTPQYFVKKKASQKRRRLEKHELIKKNRKALIEIYGSAIFQQGWPVSRKQIKLALGIKQEDPVVNSIQGLADLVNAF